MPFKFFERVPDAEPILTVGNSYITTEEEKVEVNLEDVKIGSLITDIYAQNGLSDKSKSIFKVEEMSASLPDTMSDVTKRQSVQSLLGIFGLTVDEVTADGNKRIQYILAALTDITNSIAADIASMETEVENHKKAIGELEKNIAGAKREEQESREQIATEAERIESLIKFIGGE